MIYELTSFIMIFHIMYLKILLFNYFNCETNHSNHLLTEAMSLNYHYKVLFTYLNLFCNSDAGSGGRNSGLRSQTSSMSGQHLGTLVGGGAMNNTSPGNIIDRSQEALTLLMFQQLKSQYRNNGISLMQVMLMKAFLDYCKSLKNKFR